MAINFPSSPTLNQTYTLGSKTWVYNGYAWDIVTANLTPTFNTTNAAFGVANAAFGHSNTTYAGVNSAFGVINAAFTQSNTDNVRLSAAYVTLNAGYTVANAGFDKANAANVLAYNTGIGANNYAGAMANSVNSYTSATYSTITQFSSVFGVANASFGLTNNTYGAVNSAFGVINAAFTQSNTDNVRLSAAYVVVNSAFGSANAVGGYANQAGVIANAAFGLTNTTYAAVNSAFGVINAAFGKANTALQNSTVTLSGTLTTTGTVNANSYIIITPPDGSGSEGGEIQLQSPGTYTNWSTDAYQNNYRVFARTGTSVSNVNFFHATSSGNVRVGVNRTDPGYALDVWGQVNASGYLISGTPIYDYVNTSTIAANTYANNTFVKKVGDTITGDLVVQGNLTTSGVVTYANTQTLLIGDAIITLNNDIPAATAPSEDAGVEIKRGSSANVSILWREGNDNWTLTNDGSTWYSIATNTDISSTLTASLSAANQAGVIANAAFGHSNNTYIAVNSAFGAINAAFTKANNALANTSGAIFNGTLVVGGAGSSLLNVLDRNVSVTGTSGYYRSNNITRLWDSVGGDTIAYTNTGLVGIGTTSPAYKLDVVGSSGSIIRAVTNDVTAANNAGVLLYATSSGTQATRRASVVLDPNGGDAVGTDYFYIDTYGNGQVNFKNSLNGTWYFSNNTTNLLTLLDSGNFGIGTTNPSAKLQISRTLTNTDWNALTIENYGSWAGANGKEARINFTDGSGTVGTLGVSYNGNGYLTIGNFYTVGGTYASSGEVMRVGGDGKVGIGTSSPQAALHVVSSNGGSTAVFSTANTLYGAGAYVYNNENKGIASYVYSSGYTGGSVFSVGANGSVVYSSANAAFGIGTYGAAQPLLLGTNGSERMRIDPTGNVGIANTNPQAPLHVYRNTSSVPIALFEGGSGMSPAIELKDAAATPNRWWLATGILTTTDGKFGIYDARQSVSRLTIEPTGNTGFGTNGPLAKVDIRGAAGNTAMIVGGAGGGDIYIDYQGGGSNYYDANTHIIRNGAGAAERMRIDASGYVRIGSTSGIGAGEILSANGFAIIGRTGSNPQVLIGDTAAGTGVIGTYNSYLLEFRTNNFARMNIDTVGNVAIGSATTAAVTKLQVGTKVGDDNSYSYDANSLMVIHQTPTTTTTLNDPKTVLMLARQGTGGQAYGAAAQFNMSRYENNGVNSRTRLDFTLAHGSFIASNTTVMTMLSNGYVGIGTTAPSQKLQVIGTVAATVAVDGSDSTGVRLIPSSSNGVVRFTVSDGSPRAHITGYDVGGGGGILHFSTNDSSGNMTERVRIDQVGNVGIGNTAPAYKLQVDNGAIVRIQGGWSHTIDNSSIRAVVPSGSAATLRLGQTAVADWSITNLATSGNLQISESSGANVTITTAGNVGIGTTAPAYRLQVLGSFAANTKSFVIDHPTKPGMKLRYGSLEGPENGVYVRGRLDGEKVIILPDYWEGLVDLDSITVNLTAIGHGQNLYVSGIDGLKIHIDTENHTQPYCFYHVYAERKDVEKLVVEFDA